MARLGNPNEQLYVFVDEATAQPSAPQTVGDLVQVANYVWDTNALDWVKAVGSTGVGTDVTVTNFPASQAVTGPLTDAELRASPVVVTGGASGPPGVTPVQFGLSSTVVGQQAMAASVPVVIASNQGAVPVSMTPGVSPVQFGLSSTVVGQQAMAASMPVVIASNQTAIPVTSTPSGTPASTFVTGTVAVLGTVGAQQSGIWSFGINPPMPVTPVQFGLSSTTMGQKAMAQSVPVTLATDQPLLQVGGLGSVVVTNTVLVQGPVGESNPVAGNPLGMGGRVAINNDPAHENGEITFQQLDKQGRSVVTPFSVRGLSRQGTCLLQGTVETVFIVGGGSTVFQDLSGLIIANGNSTLPVRVMIRGALGSTVLQNHNLLPSETHYVEFTRPLESPAKNMAWTAQLAGAAGSVWVSGQVVRLI